VFWSVDTQSFRSIRSSLTVSRPPHCGWCKRRPTRRLCTRRFSSDGSAVIQAITAGGCANYQTIRLRELSRLEDDLAQDHNRLINQLREQLHRYFPQLLQISSAAEDAWVWDLIEIAPVPAVACKLTRGRIERVLKRHRVRRLTSEGVMAALRLPALKLAPGSAEAASEQLFCYCRGYDSFGSNGWTLPLE